MDEAFSALDPLSLGDRIAIQRDGEFAQQGTGQQIVLNPANDCIARFVRDVNGDRVICCRTLALAGAPVQGPDVDARVVIEDVARLPSADDKEVTNVVSSKGKHLGIISISDLISAIVPPNPQAAEQAGYAQVSSPRVPRSGRSRHIRWTP
jgi:glycine betaine/proline transport system ATP-binding protein